MCATQIVNKCVRVHVWVHVYMYTCVHLLPTSPPSRGMVPTEVDGVKASAPTRLVCVSETQPLHLKPSLVSSWLSSSFLGYSGLIHNYLRDVETRQLRVVTAQFLGYSGLIHKVQDTSLSGFIVSDEGKEADEYGNTVAQGWGLGSRV